MAKYPHTKIAYRKGTYLMGSAVYDVWRHRSPKSASVVGTIERTGSKSWRLTMSTPDYKNRVFEEKTLGALRLKAVGIWDKINNG